MYVFSPRNIYIIYICNMNISNSTIDPAYMIECGGPDGKLITHLPTYFPVFNCIEESLRGKTTIGRQDNDQSTCFIWGCLLSIILTLLAAGTLVSFLLLCRSHIIVDGSRTTKLIFFSSFSSCALFLLQQFIDGNPHIAAIGELIEGSVSICVAFVLASLLCRIYEKPKNIVYIVMPLFSVVTVANLIIFICGSFGTFTSKRNHILDCHDPTWILFNVLDAILCTFSLLAAYGISRKMKKMLISENYRKKKTQQIWIVATIYSLSTYVTLIYSITRYVNSFKPENANICDHWEIEKIENATTNDALSKLCVAVLMYIIDTFIPMWAVVILIRDLFPADATVNRSSSWSGEEYIGTPGGSILGRSSLLDDDSLLDDGDDGGKTLSTRDLILDKSYSKDGGGYLSSKTSHTYSLTS
jgi:hypothetical protein